MEDYVTASINFDKLCLGELCIRNGYLSEFGHSRHWMVCLNVQVEYKYINFRLRNQIYYSNDKRIEKF